MNWRAIGSAKFCQKTDILSVTNGGSVSWLILEESVTLYCIGSKSYRGFGEKMAQDNKPINIYNTFWLAIEKYQHKE